MKTLNTIAFLLVLGWTAGWTVAAIRAYFRAATLRPCPVRRDLDLDHDYCGS